MKLTESSLSKIHPGERQEVYVRDSRLTGYAVRARRMADGSIKRTFLAVYQQTVDGRRRTYKSFIGDWRDPWTEAEARKEAQRLLAMRGSGECMVSAKKKARGERTVSDLCEVFRSDHLPDLKPETAKDYERHMAKRIMPRFGGRRVADLTRADIKDWHRGFKDIPYEGNRALAVLSKMLAIAIENEWLDSNPARGIKKYEETSRDVWLNEQELPLFIAELNKQTGPHAECLRFLTVTGWRVSEALNLRFDMVDLGALSAKLPETKTGVQTRALSSDAAIIIDRQPHRVGYVFSGRHGLERIGYKQVRLLLREICRAAGITIISPHVLRSTAATYAALNAASLFELKEGFGWRSLTMPERYVKRAEGLSRAGAEKAADAINIFGKPAAAVREIKG